MRRLGRGSRSGARSKKQREEASGRRPAERRLGRRFDRFTERARRVLVLAQEEAVRLNHNFIGTEHLLLGLVREGEGVGSKTLSATGVELERVRAEVERVIGRGSEQATAELTLTSRCKRVLALAVKEAEQLNHAYVGTAHLLLGLIREDEGVAARILSDMGVQLDNLRERIRDAARTAPLEEYLGPLRMDPTGLTRDSVITIRVSDEDLAAVDSLVEAGIMKTRSEAAAWLLNSGIAASKPLFEKADGLMAEIRRLREEAQQLAREHAGRQA
jgi:hypothetical protein